MNTGTVEKLKNELRVCVDWIGFTFFGLTDVKDVIEFLGYKDEDFTQLPKGGMGYKSILQLNGYTLQILYDGKENMGIHVNISGSSVTEVIRSFLETKKIDTVFGDAYDIDFNSNGLITFFDEVSKVANFTRIDIAIDDIGTQFFSLDGLRSLLAGETIGKKIVSKFRKWQEVCQKRLTGEKTGHTIYMGSRQSETFLRVYDKRLEQAGKKGTDLGVEWTRWELEFKGERANQVANLIVKRQEVGAVFIGVLNNYVRVVNLDDSNISRCSLDTVWQKFVNTVEKLRLYVAQAEKTLEEKENWFKFQVAPTMAGIIVSKLGDMSIIYDYFEDYLTRMSKDMRNICDKYNPTWREDWGLNDECVA